MPLPKRYAAQEAEPDLIESWDQSGVYQFDRSSTEPMYSIDTPPPTVSGHLHLGHVYSYSHADFIARFRRMLGYNVLYPIGYDDNGLPTEKLVEKQLGKKAAAIGRTEFTAKCMEVGEQAEHEYRALWRRLGLSFDWRYTYRTIDPASRRTAQYAFIRLYEKDLLYRQKAPTIWCPQCQTAIAQAEVSDLELSAAFVTLAFHVDDRVLPIATTRPELLCATVAVFVHPADERWRGLIGRQARVPLYDRDVDIIGDETVDPEKGTGVVMCCTFGDTTDIEWWRTYELPYLEAIDRQGKMTALGGAFAGLPVVQARKQIIDVLTQKGSALDTKPIVHTVRVHERDDVPVEYRVSDQWFVRVLDHRAKLLEAGATVRWHPEHMEVRYREWVENLNWDWGISRQRYFGVPIPVWYCQSCGEVTVASLEHLPVDPTAQTPPPCRQCGGQEFHPDHDVLDTWFTSSLSPAIVGRWLEDPALFNMITPMSVRPQAHEIIRTWAFYTIVQSVYHFDRIPWSEALISGWGLAPQGLAKISKSRGGGPLPPLEMIERFSADAVRYWAASTGPGKDAVISEEKIGLGVKLVTKLWNVARFSEPFLAADAQQGTPNLSPVDRWLLTRIDKLVEHVTDLMMNYEYAAAKSEIELFFWRDLADNYLELAKARLYDSSHPQSSGASYTLRYALLTTLKLFAPFLPFATDRIYRELFANDAPSLHRSSWPQPRPDLRDDTAEAFGEVVVELATAVRRFKSTERIALGTELPVLQVVPSSADMEELLQQSIADLRSVTRARTIELVPQINRGLLVIHETPIIAVVPAGEPSGNP
jgi:valyl-tRNA synthetase